MPTAKGTKTYTCESSLLQSLCKSYWVVIHTYIHTCQKLLGCHTYIHTYMSKAIGLLRGFDGSLHLAAIGNLAGGFLCVIWRDVFFVYFGGMFSLRILAGGFICVFWREVLFVYFGGMILCDLMVACVLAVFFAVGAAREQQDIRRCVYVCVCVCVCIYVCLCVRVVISPACMCTFIFSNLCVRAHVFFKFVFVRARVFF